ncbi:MAG TPA: response regulator [Hyphomicrobiaceae bacterium]|nr:response regulator [Hyphomicrobiaceae bacterium]
MSPQSLNGARILVVEDEPLIALEIGEGLVEAGAVVIGPSSTVARALDLVGTRDLEAAILDVRLDGETVFPVAAALCARAIPFVFHTGDAIGRTLAADWPDNEVLSKPADRARIVAVLAKLLEEN